MVLCSNPLKVGVYSLLCLKSLIESESTWIIEIECLIREKHQRTSSKHFRLWNKHSTFEEEKNTSLILKTTRSSNLWTHNNRREHKKLILQVSESNKICCLDAGTSHLQIQPVGV